MDHFQKNLQQAFALYNAGRLGEAEALGRPLAQLNRPSAQLFFLLGMIFHKTDRDEEAVQFFQKAVELSPRAIFFHGLGCAFHSLKNFPRAIENFAKAIELKPGRGDLFYSLGNSLHATGEIERALAAFQTAVELNPRDAPSWNNVGKTWMQLNRVDEAVAAYNRAVEVDPNYDLARYGRAIALLTSGDFKNGFRDYEIRKKIKPRKFSPPEWCGEPIPGKTLLLHAEQGFGDAIQAVRFIQKIRGRAGKIILECRPELKTLFQFSNCADEIVAYGESMPHFDLVASLNSLPHILDVSLETVLREIPYLKAPISKNFPAAKNGNLKIGFVWAGNPGHHDDRSRSVRVEDFAPILQTAGITFYSFQKPISAADKNFLQTFPGIIELGSHFRDFLDTAAAIVEMDLLICVDTGVAHLAGALGKPVWTLIQFAPDWRWFLDRPDTIWYPTMRLFRQKKRGEWKPVIAEVAEELKNLFLKNKPPKHFSKIISPATVSRAVSFPNLTTRRSRQNSADRSRG